ncbi:MAG: Uma2 family endonuclease [Planctomycetota bacterium]
MSTLAHFTLQDYDRLIALGAFEPKERWRCELIQGEIRDMSPIGPLHEFVLGRLARWSFASAGSLPISVRLQCSIELPERDCALEPDLAWARGPDDRYAQRRPDAGDVLLLIEIADSSLSYDTGEKANLYAEAGIADYWVVNIPDRCIEIRREAEGGRYRSLRTVRGDEAATPLCAADAPIRPNDLFPREPSEADSR